VEPITIDILDNYTVLDDLTFIIIHHDVTSLHYVNRSQSIFTFIDIEITIADSEENAYAVREQHIVDVAQIIKMMLVKVVVREVSE
jgi:hypothetical protein